MDVEDEEEAWAVRRRMRSVARTQHAASLSLLLERQLSEWRMTTTIRRKKRNA